ncbi:MAG: hypothetical protein ABSG19_00080 [Candidatus Aminicenantales bacterium]
MSTSHPRSSRSLGSSLSLVLIAAAACAAGLLLLSAKSGGSTDRPLQDANAGGTLSPARIQELQAADKDILGNLELAKKADPSYESVAAYLPAMKNPREVVGVRYHPHDIGIAPDGTLQLSDDVAGAPTAFFEGGSPAVRFGSGPAGCVKSLLQGYLPIVTARFAHDGIEYKETVFGYSDGLSPDKELWAFVELEAKNSVLRAREATVGLRFNPASPLNAAKTWTLKLAAGVEVTHLFTGANEPTLPHLYSCTQQLRLLRMMLVREDGLDLRLAQAVPQPWLEAGRKIDIQNAPTKFGPVSFTIESHIDRGRIDVRLTAPAREAPRNILLRLRHPQEKPIKRVTVDGKPLTSFAGDTVTLASPRGALKIVVEYE